MLPALFITNLNVSFSKSQVGPSKTKVVATHVDKTNKVREVFTLIIMKVKIMCFSNNKLFRRINIIYKEAINDAELIDSSN